MLSRGQGPNKILIMPWSWKCTNLNAKFTPSSFISVQAPECVSLTNIRIGVVCVWLSGWFSRDGWRQQTDTRSTTFIQVQVIQVRTWLLCSVLTCCGRWQSCGCCLPVLLLSLLVSFGLFGGVGVLRLFVLLLVLLLLLAFFWRSPHPARNTWKDEENRRGERFLPQLMSSTF